MDGIEKKNKTITLTSIVRYVLGTFFLVMSLGSINLHNYIAGILFFLAAIVTIPLFKDMVKKKSNTSISSASQLFVVFCLVALAFAAIPDTPTTSNDKDIIASPQSTISGSETAEAKKEQTQVTSSTDSISIVGTNYKCGSWSNEQYPLMRLFGDDYVPLYPNNERIWGAHVDKLAKLILDLPDEGERYTLKAGEILDLGQGYGLEPKQIDVAGKMVWFEFTKDGAYIDDEIIKFGNGSDGTWSINLDGIQGVNNVVVFKVHVSNILEGTTDSIVQLDGLWLIDYANVKTLNIGDKLGGFTLQKIINGVDESNPGYLVFEQDKTTTEGNSIKNQETSSVSEPTSSSEQVSEPETIEFSGNGPEATKAFRLEKGLSKFILTHDGSSNFAIWLMDGKSGQKLELLANEIGLFDGSKAVGIVSEGDYVLDVTADGSWKIVIEQPRQAGTQSTPLTLSGKGQKVSEIFYLENGLKRFQMKHDGSSNFAVWLIDSQGNKIELLANEIGNFNGSKAVGITESGTYLLDVQADGNWEISIE